MNIERAMLEEEEAKPHNIRIIIIIECIGVLVTLVVMR